MMDLAVKIFLGTVLGYLVGSIPFGFIFVKLSKNVDLRSYGSGSTGATNVSRVLGKKVAALVAVLDALKAIGAYAIVINLTANPLAAFIAALAAIVGHCYPVWLGFKGGKGVSTSFGAAIIINTLPAILTFFVFVFAVIASKRVSIGSLTAAWTFFGISVFTKVAAMPMIFAIFLAIFLTITHRENIKRIIEGKEKPLWQ
ncbi:acyl-phosphate glycerol 3-phosphate acyltransferase [bacterium]|nr:MAG: acyl-phosphate glycerol 3-phosphate acyltransferase [bacterium]